MGPAERSLAGSVQAGLAGIDPGALVLITTADHALLDAATLDYFLDRVVENNADVSVGLVDYALVRRAYPGVRRTVLKFSEGGYCGCNLYALNGARAREIISLWQRTQAYRKHPWRMALGVIRIQHAAPVSQRPPEPRRRPGRPLLDSTGINAEFHRDLPFPHAGIDIDTPADLELWQNRYWNNAIDV